MASKISAADQADLMEKEKLVMEHQQRFASLRELVKTMAGRQISLKRTMRRAEITVNELTSLKSDHVVYRGVGRAFMRTPVNSLIELNNEAIERSEAEERRLASEKQRTSEMMVKEEGELQRAIEDYKKAIQIIQAIQS